MLQLCQLTSSTKQQLAFDDVAMGPQVGVEHYDLCEGGALN